MDAVKQAKQSGRTEVMTVLAQDLVPHPRVQRRLNEAKVKKLMADADLDAIGTMHAVRYPIEGVTRDWQIDGNHRRNMLINLGLGEWPVELMVHLDVKEDARAADLFLKLNNRFVVDAFDRFEQAFIAGHSEAVGAQDVAERHGYVISKSNGNGHLSCVQSLQRLWSADGGVTLDATLGTIVEAWGHTAASSEGKLIEGLGLLYRRYGAEIDRPALVTRIAKYPGRASALLGDAKGHRQLRRMSMTRSVAESIRTTYNAQRRAHKLDPL